MKARLEEMITIACATPGMTEPENKEVEGRRVTRHFAITRSINELFGEYTLTHRPTGRSVYSTSQFSRLLKYAKLLEKIGDWSFTDPASVKNIEPSMRLEAMRKAALL